MAPHATKKRKPKTLPLPHVVTALFICVLIYIVIDVARWGTNQLRTHQELENLEENLATLQTQRGALEAHLEYINSDVYIEQIARNELKWSRPGEKTIVIVSDTQERIRQPSSALPRVPTPTPTPLDSWRERYFPDQNQTRFAPIAP